MIKRLLLLSIFALNLFGSINIDNYINCTIYKYIQYRTIDKNIMGQWYIYRTQYYKLKNIDGKKLIELSKKGYKDFLEHIQNDCSNIEDKTYSEYMGSFILDPNNIRKIKLINNIGQYFSFNKNRYIDKIDVKVINSDNITNYIQYNKKGIQILKQYNKNLVNLKAYFKVKDSIILYESLNKQIYDLDILESKMSNDPVVLRLYIEIEKIEVYTLDNKLLGNIIIKEE